MNNEQIKTAVEMFKQAFGLLNDARDILDENGIDLCGISPVWSYPFVDEVHVYSGITKLAQAYETEVNIDESVETRDKVLKIGDIKFFQIMLPDGTYR